MSMATPSPGEVANFPAPNYVDPENLHALTLGLCIPPLVLAIIFMGVRFYGKGLLRQILGPDDWVMLAATILAIPSSIFPLICLNLGLGLHVWDQKPEWHTPYYKLGYIADLTFPMACSLTKISLCMTYIRLFPNRSTKWFCYIMMCFVTVYTVACFFLSLFQCRPIRGYWDRSVQLSCINMRATLVVIAALNSFSDFLVYLWPAKPLWSLQLPLKQRLGLIFIFSVGLCVCIAGVMRMYYLEVYFSKTDLLWYATPIWITMNLEMALGIICGCLSGVKPVMAKVFPSIFGSSHSRSRTRPSGQTYGLTTGTNNKPEAFAFEQLSDLSSRNHDNKMDNHTVRAMHSPEHTEQKNYAWATSNGNLGLESNIPAGAIGVHQSVTIIGEDSSSATPTKANSLSDAGSEEWIMEEPKRSPAKIHESL